MSKVSCLSHTANAATAPLPALEEMLDDIGRLIFHVVSPYVDDSNPMLHREELCAECRYKLARIISAGKMQQCATRAKFFGYLKVSFRNHVLTLVQKHAFCWKRTGIRPPRDGSLAAHRDGVTLRTKPLHLSLDDEDLGLQVGRLDEGRLLQEVIEELEASLSEDERNCLRRLENSDRPFPQARCLVETKRSDSSNGRPNWKLRRYAAGLGMTVEEFIELRRRIRFKCKAVVART